MVVGLLMALIGGICIGVLFGRMGLPWWLSAVVGGGWGYIAVEIGLKFFK